MRYDLHCHTHFSDGDRSVEELFKIASKSQLAGLSITDHDTTQAYQQAFELAKHYQLKLVTGVEVSCLHKGSSVHVLAYSFSLHDPLFNQFLQTCKERRQSRNKEMIQNLQKMNFDITQEELEETFNKELQSIGRPHFATLMAQKGYVLHVRDAFNRYLGDGKPCFVVGSRPSVTEALEAIHRANAFASLAHPHFLKNSLLEQQLLELPFDALEAYYAKISPKDEKPWVEKAKERNWMITGGSDFHGQIKPLNKLGCSWVPHETFHILEKRHLENDKLFTVD